MEEKQLSVSKENIITKIKKILRKLFTKKDDTNKEAITLATETEHDKGAVLEKYKNNKEEFFELYEKVKNSKVDLYSIPEEVLIKISQMIDKEIELEEKECEKLEIKLKSIS